MRLRLQGTSREWKHENLSLDLSGSKALFLTTMLYTHVHTLTLSIHKCAYLTRVNTKLTYTHIQFLLPWLVMNPMCKNSTNFPLG